LYIWGEQLLIRELRLPFHHRSNKNTLRPSGYSRSSGLIRGQCDTTPIKIMKRNYPLLGNSSVNHSCGNECEHNIKGALEIG
jgi:hypothetical protein